MAIHGRGLLTEIVDGFGKRLGALQQVQLHSLARRLRHATLVVFSSLLACERPSPMADAVLGGVTNSGDGSLETLEVLPGFTDSTDLVISRVVWKRVAVTRRSSRCTPWPHHCFTGIRRSGWGFQWRWQGGPVRLLPVCRCFWRVVGEPICCRQHP